MYAEHCIELREDAVEAFVLVSTVRGVMLFCILAVEPGKCLTGFNVARLSLDDSMYDVARVGYDTSVLSD